MSTLVLIDRVAAATGYDLGAYGTAGDCCGEGDKPPGSDPL